MKILQGLMLKHVYILLILNFPQNMQAAIFPLSVTSLHPFPFIKKTVSFLEFVIMDRNSNEMGLVAYNFEPEYSEEEMTSRSQQHSIAEASSAFNV
jgi:hypothetical protein